MNALLSLLTLLILIPACALADDAGLYDPVAPEGSAFIRVLKLFEAEELGVTLNGKTFEPLAPYSISSYFIFDDGDLHAMTEKNAPEESFRIKAGAFYTLKINKDSTFILLEDPVNDNRAKAQILFYNGSDRDNLSLKTANGRISIIKDINPDTVGARQINPVKLDMGVYNSADEQLRTLAPVSLERGLSYSVVFFGIDQDILWIQNTTDTTR